jgi:predicted dehydrogenase
VTAPPEPRTLRWGIVGLGSLAENGLVPAASRARRARIVACSTRDPAKARAFAARHGIPRWHPDHESLVRDPEVDAVFVATPNALHAAPVLAAAAAGKPVLCEKPLAPTVEEAERMVAACHAAGVMLRLGLHLRFERFLDRVGDLLRGGAIGEVRALSVERAAPPAERVPWREDPAQGGGVLHDVGVHLLDLAPRLLGAPLLSVAGLAFPPRGAADTITLLAEAVTGAQVTLRMTREAPRAAADLMALGTNGFLRTGPLRWVSEYGLTVTTGDGATREESATPCDLYRDELDGFALDLADGGTRLGTGEGGLRLVRVALAAEEALRSGRRVPLPDA